MAPGPGGHHRPRARGIRLVRTPQADAPTDDHVLQRMGRPGGPEEQLGQPRREPRRPLRVPVHPRVRGPGMEEIRFTAPPGDPVAVAARQDETGEEKATRGPGSILREPEAWPQEAA